MVAVGEIGLDYYWDKENRDLQKMLFIRQLELARQLDLPVIIHSREAAADTMEIMKQYAGELSGVIHCFSYSADFQVLVLSSAHLFLYFLKRYNFFAFSVVCLTTSS